jgi:uridine kinase
MKHGPFVIVEGTLILARPELNILFDESVFIEVNEDIRFQRRLYRDVNERGRTAEGVRQQFYNQVKPMHDQFVEPSKSACTLLVRDNREVLDRHAKSHMHSEILELVKRFVALP